MRTHTLTLYLSDKEDQVLRELAESQGITKSAVLRQGLSLYQLVRLKQAEGRKVQFTGEPNRTYELLGILQ